MNINLENKNAIVTGASSGLGKAIAIELARAGANVLLIARRENVLMETINELPNNGSQKHSLLAVNMSDLQLLKQSVMAKLNYYRHFDIIVNNSGGPKPGRASESQIDDFINAFKMQLFAFQEILQIALPTMKTQNWGRIINITSVGAKQPIANLGVSNTLRGAVTSWSKTLAHELAPYGITVNNILPGFILTDRLVELLKSEAKRKGITYEQELQHRQSSVPAGRIGKPEDIAFAATFLASEQASYINGINLPVDGGFLQSV
jgi:3-oxoacyl-[acyl-carrier protein] reductase